MSTIVDATGFSCPQPVLMTLNEMKKEGAGEITVLVDTVASRENVARAAAAEGWTVAGVETEGSTFRIRIVKD